MTSTPSSATSTEAGTGVIGTVVGVAIFLSLLLFAVQVLVGLHATTVVSAAAYDAAKTVAGADAGSSPAARAHAVAEARRRLGRVGDRASFTWGSSEESVVLTVRAPRPRFFHTAPDIERTVRVRVERVR